MITNKFKQFLSEQVPRKISNVIFQIFNGIQAVLQHFEYQMEINKRESNILTAQYKSSLRNLASMNGYEPQLKQSSTGILHIKVSSSVFQRYGYPLYIKPYAVFKNKLTKAEYIYNSDVSIRITDNNLFVPVIEGVLINDTSNRGNGDYIQRLYLPDNIADGSILIESNSKKFKQVKSFVANTDVNENRQFIVKYSRNPKTPIVVYVKGVEPNMQIDVTYILTNGSYGNLPTKNYFETDAIIDKYGGVITFDEEELVIQNSSGFQFGSDGSDENDLRAAIGYNHGIDILFDNISYRNFLNKFSNVLVQDIKIHRTSKQVNNIYLWRRCYPGIDDIVKNYKRSILNREYILGDSEKQSLDKLIRDKEYCLSSHTINDAKVERFAFQLLFDTEADIKSHQEQLEQLLYTEFSKFLYLRNHSFSVLQFFSDYQKQHKVSFEALVFAERNGIYEEPVIIHNNGYDSFGKKYVENDSICYLPILSAGFTISKDVIDISEPIQIELPISFGVKLDIN